MTKLIFGLLTFHRSAHFLENSANTTCSSGCFFLCSSRQVWTKNAYAVIRPLGLPSACFPRPILTGGVWICCRCWLFWLFCWWFCWICCWCSCICWFCWDKLKRNHLFSKSSKRRYFYLITITSIVRPS